MNKLKKIFVNLFIVGLIIIIVMYLVYYIEKDNIALETNKMSLNTKYFSNSEYLKQVNIEQSYPYIQNNILYTKLKTIAIKDIKKIELEESPIRYFIITWQTDAYTMGMFTMSYEDFKKIEIDLLGDTYEKARASQKKE